MSQCSLRWYLLGAALFLFFTPGCGGCRQTDSDSSDEDSQEPKPVVIISEPLPLPYGNDVFRMLVKPGHVVEAQQEFKVGAIDIKGRIEGQSFSKAGQPLPVPGSRWSLNFTRDVSLPKQQTKQFELRFFVSPSLERDENSLIPINPDLRTVLIDRETETPMVSPRPTAITPLPKHQYFFVVLSDHKDDYEFLNKTDIVSWPSLEIWDSELQAAYQLILCSKAGDRWRLPSTFFGWTSTAFLIWDDVDPDSLSSAQKQALIDWLHWGGQIIISGPTSMSRLTGSFLEPYLPLQASTTGSFAQPNVDFLNSTWALREPTVSFLRPRGQLLPEDPEASDTSMPNTPDSNAALASPAPTNSDGSLEEEFRPVIPKATDPLDSLSPLPSRSIPLVNGTLTYGSSWVNNSGELIAEKMVGRGRVVLSTFSISDPYFARWRSFSSFLNATMLGRPPRAWQENTFNSQQTWLYQPNQEGDSRLATHFRISTRDGLAGLVNEKVLFDRQSSKSKAPLNWKNVAEAGSVVSGWDGDPINGIASWNSSSSASNAAKSILRKAAGVNVPKVKTIALLLLCYLACVVPLNWFIFFLIGKIEWAWAAVPFIATIGVGLVAYIAQLDIGFARSYTEVAVVEAFENHSRAHVTRYSAIYSSLSTPYKLTLDSDSGLTVPMISRERELSSTLVETVRFDYGSADGNFLYPLNILSNSTTLLHTEQMIDMGGQIQFSYDGVNQNRMTLINQTNYSWEAVAAIRRNSDGLLEAAWIGSLPSKGSSSSDFSSASLTQLVDFWNWRNAKVRREDTPDDDPSNFADLMRSIASLEFMRTGEMRVIAFSNGTVDGLDIQPSSGSSLKYCALVLHVACGQYPDPVPDRSLPTRQMVIEVDKLEDEAEKETIDGTQAENSPTVDVPPSTPKQ